MSRISYGPSLITNGLVLAVDAANSRSYSGTGTIAWAVDRWLELVQL